MNQAVLKKNGIDYFVSEMISIPNFSNISVNIFNFIVFSNICIVSLFGDRVTPYSYETSKAFNANMAYEKKPVSYKKNRRLIFYSYNANRHIFTN